MDRFTGGCLCGNVRIVASGLPYRVGLCHCLDCRKHHGALFKLPRCSLRMRCRSMAKHATTPGGFSVPAAADRLPSSRRTLSERAHSAAMYSGSFLTMFQGPSNPTESTADASSSICACRARYGASGLLSILLVTRHSSSSLLSYCRNRRIRVPHLNVRRISA
jgi:hypothetical protein